MALYAAGAAGFGWSGSVLLLAPNLSLVFCLLDEKFVFGFEKGLRGVSVSW